jgi:hypothetical protein
MDIVQIIESYHPLTLMTYPLFEYPHMLFDIIHLDATRICVIKFALNYSYKLIRKNICIIIHFINVFNHVTRSQMLGLVFTNPLIYSVYSSLIFPCYLSPNEISYIFFYFDSFFIKGCMISS